MKNRYRFNPMKRSFFGVLALIGLVLSGINTSNKSAIAQSPEATQQVPSAYQIFIPLVVETSETTDTSWLTTEQSILPPEVVDLIYTTHLAHDANYPDPNETIETVTIYLEGLSLLEGRQFDQALDLFRNSVALYPTSRYMHEGLASALKQKFETSGNVEDLREATLAYINAEELGLEFEKTHYSYPIARGLVELQDVQLLEQVFASILEKASDLYRAKLNYANALISFEGTDPKTWFLGAIELELQGNKDATLDYAEWLLAQNRFADVLALPEHTISTGDPIEGTHFTTVIVDSTEVPYLHFLRGFAFEKLADMEQAVAEYEKYLASGINSVFPVPSKFRIDGSQLQDGIGFEGDVRIAATDTQAQNLLSNLIACEAGGESTGGMRAVAWTVRTRVNRAYNVSTACGGYHPSTNGVWGAISSGSSNADKYMAIMQAPNQFWETCGWASPTNTTNVAAYNVYIGIHNDPVTSYCPNGSHTGTACDGFCSMAAYGGASATGPAWFVSTSSACSASGPAGTSCSTLVGKTCGNGSSDNCFYRIK